MSQLNDVIKSAVENLKKIVDANTIIGNPISTGSGTTIIPVSKVTVGIASGGIDYAAKNSASAQNFGGGNGAGVSVSPVAFIVISADGKAELLNMAPTATDYSDPIQTIDRIVTKTPEIVEKLKELFPQKNAHKDKDSFDIGE